MKFEICSDTGERETKLLLGSTSRVLPIIFHFKFENLKLKPNTGEDIVFLRILKFKFELGTVSGFKLYILSHLNKAIVVNVEYMCTSLLKVDARIATRRQIMAISLRREK